jgi:hypothetical protein
VLDEMSMFVKYVNTQESNLNSIEQQKNDYRNTFFTKDITLNKDITFSKDIKDTTKN